MRLHQERRSNNLRGGNESKEYVQIDGMLIATFLTTFFYSSTYPHIYKEVMTAASDSFIASKQIINCVSVITFGYLWNKKSDILFRFYPVFCILESTLGIATTVFVIVTNNIAAYYLLDVFVFSIVTRNICCGGVKLRAARYDTERKREHFDNNNNSVSSLATILGSILAMFLKLNFSAMICIATCGNIIDNLFSTVLFYQTRNKKIITTN